MFNNYNVIECLIFINKIFKHYGMILIIFLPHPPTIFKLKEYV